MEQKSLTNGLKRPQTFKMSDYPLDDIQERLCVAMIEDIGEANNVLARLIRFQYWTKRIWEASVENYKMSKRLD